MNRAILLLVVGLSLGIGPVVSSVLAQTEQAEPLAADAEYSAAEGSGSEGSAERELETDRDAFTPATSTTGTGLAIVETSYSFIDNRHVAETNSYPELLARYGISERIELRLGWNYEVGGAGDFVSGSGAGEVFSSELERESQMLYGFKAGVTEQDGWTPRSVVIVQGYTPTSGPSPATDVAAAYAFGWELPNRWRLESAMRYVTDHDRTDAMNLWAPSAILRVPITEQWNVHAEYFGIYSQGSERDFSRSLLSPGTHYLITPNLELGVRVGWGITSDSPNFFSNVGLGWRF